MTDPEQPSQTDNQAATVGVIQRKNDNESEVLDEKAKGVLRRLNDDRITTLVPTFDVDTGFKYTDLSEFELHEQLNILYQFDKAGIVTSELFQSVLMCPECGSTRFSVQLSCEVCQSSNISRGAVIEHLLCGNIDFDSKYGKEDESVFACPKCGKRLKAIGVDYARPGIFYRCLNCKALLPQTNSAHTCLKCTKKWSEAELVELNLSKYTIDVEKAAKQFVHSELLPIVAKMLYSKHGLKAESPGKVRGLSKVEHTFDLLISHYESGEPILAADLMMLDDKTGDHMANVRILAFYAKCLDANYITTNVIKKILVTHSDIGPEARELASAYSVILVQTKDPNEMTSLVLKMLGREQPQE